jgi:hypothetical protein
VLYQVQNTNDSHAVARGLEYEEAVDFIKRETLEDPDSSLEIVPEVLTIQSWWEFTSVRDGTCVYAWGDDDQSDVWLAHLQLQHSPDFGVWHRNELGIRQAFELGLYNSCDGLDLTFAIPEVRLHLLGCLDRFLSATSTLAAPSLFVTETADVVCAIEEAYEFALQLEYVGISGCASAAVRKALEGSDWQFTDERPSRIVQRSQSSTAAGDASRPPTLQADLPALDPAAA